MCHNHFIGKVADDTLDEIRDSYNPRLRLSHQSLSPPESISILRSILTKNISKRISNICKNYMICRIPEREKVS